MFCCPAVVKSPARPTTIQPGQVKPGNRPVSAPAPPGKLVALAIRGDFRPPSDVLRQRHISARRIRVTRRQLSRSLAADGCRPGSTRDTGRAYGPRRPKPRRPDMYRLHPDIHPNLTGDSLVTMRKTRTGKWRMCPSPKRLGRRTIPAEKPGGNAATPPISPGISSNR